MSAPPVPGRPAACRCASCRLRHLTAPVVLIAIGVLLLIHMTHPAFNGVAMAGCFLIIMGVLKLIQYAVPRGHEEN